VLTDLGVRRATAEDLAAATEAVVLAFHDDPVWSWAFSDPETRPAQFARWWGFLVEAIFRNGEVWVTGDCDAVSVWVPPGGHELTEAEETQVVPLLVDLLGSRSEVVLDLVMRFDAAHPQEVPHYYLSILATHPRARGKGLGMALTGAVLASRADAEGVPAYLESSNPANHSRYERAGFSPRETVRLPQDCPPILTMWREPR
jgi:GNAT superfamily N-acetyltransferase